ncbi:NADPH-dependent oxidoreductase 2-alkenal reductase [Linum grandiflorum]
MASVVENVEMAAGGVKIQSKQWYLSAYSPHGIPTSDHLKLHHVTIPADSVPAGHILVQTLWISVDPYLRSMMTGSADGLNLPQSKLNEVFKAFGAAKVSRSEHEDYEAGDILINPFQPVADYALIPAHPAIKKIDPSSQISPLEHLNCLGIPGFAAWLGIVKLGEAKKGDNVFISAAGGGVGMLAGQLAKLKGCRVVGSTGSDHKAQLIKEKFGYDDAFNYNEETDFDIALSKYLPNGIDIYLDNVGGRMLEAVLNHVNPKARVLLCGMISQYNKPWEEREGVRNLLNMIGKEVRMEGFMVASYLNHFEDFAKEIEGYIVQGNIRSKYKVYDGIESFLEGFRSVFSSVNDGKVVIKVNPFTKP